MVEHQRPPRLRSPRKAGLPLGEYRLYFLNDDGRISLSHEFEAESDERAVRIAEGWREGRRTELWCKDRKLRSWEAE